MDDELEDKIFYQTFMTHMKILSKFAVGFTSINSPFVYTWRLCRLYILRTEVLFCGVLLLCLLFYLQAVDTWSRSIFNRIQTTLTGGRPKSQRLEASSNDNDDQEVGSGGHIFWQQLKSQSSAFALLGRRARMEDRFIIEENVNDNTGIAFYAVFDGHGGDFAADFAKDVLVKNIYNKMIEINRLLKRKIIQKLSEIPGTKDRSAGGNRNNNANRDPLPKRSEPLLVGPGSPSCRLGRNDCNKENQQPELLNFQNSSTSKRRESSWRTSSDDSSNNLADRFLVNGAGSSNGSRLESATDVFSEQLNSLLRNIASTSNIVHLSNGGSVVGNKEKQQHHSKSSADMSAPPQALEAKYYIENERINFGKLITDEILAADYKLVQAARRSTNIAGTTALIAVIHDSRLIVANVGDSRGVMYNGRGLAIPLSFDHKPQQVRERKRIRDAGGFIAFRGVWRVAGILATSRALGDYPLKDKNLVIANPDILSFDLSDHKPMFIILASDGLWDTFTNEEACTFIREHLHESDFGAKALAMQSYNRGSVDNITVLVIVFRPGYYTIGGDDQRASSKNSGNSSTGNGSNNNGNLKATNRLNYSDYNGNGPKDSNTLNLEHNGSGSEHHVNTNGIGSGSGSGNGGPRSAKVSAATIIASTNLNRSNSFRAK